MLAWAGISLAGLPPLSGPPPQEEAVGVLDAFAAVAIGLYAFAAWRYVAIHRERGDVLSLAVAVAFVLLAQAVLAIVLSRNWHLSWWEWHLLMLAAFVAIALGARDEYQRGHSLSSAFGGLYSAATLAQIDRWHARAIATVATAEARGDPTGAVLDDLRDEGASEDEIALLSETARELRRLDTLFGPYLPTGVRRQLREDPGVARLGGEEREISVLFADLASFTTFSERHRPTEVIEMLNRYWAVVVPAIDGSGGVVDYFAGDGVLAIFNAADDQSDHARRAVQTGLAIIDASQPVAAGNPDWPIFRVGVNTGRAVVGNVGAEGRRSFTAIGDTTNTAARLVAAVEPGQVVVSDRTWTQLRGAATGIELGPLLVKGKREPVTARVVTRIAS
jgi:class 3 adenylate cyclase